MCIERQNGNDGGALSGIMYNVHASYSNVQSDHVNSS